MAKIKVVNDEWVELPATTGTVQNVSCASTIEISDKQEKNSGHHLYPFETMYFSGTQLYARVVKGGGAEVQVDDSDCAFAMTKHD